MLDPKAISIVTFIVHPASPDARRVTIINQP